MSKSISLFRLSGNKRRMMFKHISVSFLAFLLVLFRCLPAAAGQLLEDIRFVTPSSDEERVVFRMNSSGGMPKSFLMTTGNPRLVLDFEDTRATKKIKSVISVNGSLIERIRIGIHDTKTRVVLDLVPNKKVKSIQDVDKTGTILTVTVHNAAIKPAPSTTADVVNRTKADNFAQSPVKDEAKQALTRSTAVAEAPNPGSTVLGSVLFEKNSRRGEMVMFRLNRFHPPVVFGLEDKKPRVVCDFQDTVAGERLPNSINADGKFVNAVRIDSDKAEKKIRVVLDLAPNYSYDLQQVFFKNDNLFVLIINTLGGPAKNQQ